ncbi:putative tRNA (guanine(26)-N(2))-dimethyltransferase, partial [Orchesella cincta]
LSGMLAVQQLQRLLTNYCKTHVKTFVIEWCLKSNQQLYLLSPSQVKTLSPVLAKSYSKMSCDSTEEMQTETATGGNNDHQNMECSSSTAGTSSVPSHPLEEVSSSSNGANGANGGGNEEIRVISEGKVKIPQSVKIFYNPTQEFNRDMSIVVLHTFIKSESKADVTVLEAMSASGIRAIRYAKEIPGIAKVIANDYSESAVETIKGNAESNQVADIVQPSFADASSKMYEQRHAATVVDIDPYGTPTPFLDAAVQCVEDGGLLMVTATDMAVLAGGNHADSCFAKYGSMSLKSKACHEIALRIVIHTVQSCANRYGRVAIPLLSLSVDFYVRMCFKIVHSPKKTKQSVLNTSMIYQCTGCKSITLQPLAAVKKGHTTFAQGPPVSRKCETCDAVHHVAGPIWSGPIHDKDFVSKMIHELNDRYTYLGTYDRIKGMLGLVQEEIDAPLYYEVSELCSVVKASSIPLIQMRSAIMNLGYQVSLTHAEPNTIKTNIPNRTLWDILRAWRLQTNPKPMQADTIGHRVMAREATIKEIYHST